jgi:hypothetical protein
MQLKLKVLSLKHIMIRHDPLREIFVASYKLELQIMQVKWPIFKKSHKTICNYLDPIDKK